MIRILIGTVLFLAMVLSCLFLTSDRDYLKENALRVWSEHGFNIVAYNGWSFGQGLPFTTYGSAHVWYRLEKKSGNDITYSGYLVRWGDEIHVYGPKAIDAIRPN